MREGKRRVVTVCHIYQQYRLSWFVWPSRFSINERTVETKVVRSEKCKLISYFQ